MEPRVRTQLPLAVVTGASSGIGREIAASLARKGYRTILIARRRALLESLAAELNPFAPSRALVMDLSNTTAIAATIADLVHTDGPRPCW